MMANLMWIVTGVSIYATVLNLKKQSSCFLIWLFTDSLWCAYDFWIQNYAQATLMLVYTGLALWGLYEWKLKK